MEPIETDEFPPLTFGEEEREPEPASVRFRDSLSPLPPRSDEDLDSDISKMDGLDLAGSSDKAVQRTLQSSAWARLRRQNDS